MGSFKAHDPYVLQAFVFKTYWDILDSSVIQAVQHVFLI